MKTNNGNGTYIDIIDKYNQSSHSAGGYKVANAHAEERRNCTGLVQALHN